MPIFRFRIKSDTSYLPFVRGILPAIMEKCTLDPDNHWISRCNLSLVEAVNNAIIHAHKRVRDLWVHIIVEINRERMTVEIHDCGKGFKIPPFQIPTLEQTHGRGLFLMQSLMESVEYIKRKSCNVLRMKTTIPKGETMKQVVKRSKINRPEVEIESGRALDVLYDLSQAITSATSLTEVCERILDRSMRIMNVEKASIMKYDPLDGTLKIIAAKGIPQDVIKTARIKVGEGISGQVFASSKPILVKDIKTQPLATKRKRYKSRSLISAPVTCFSMKVIDAPVGVINMTDRKNGEPFTEQDLKLLRTIANQLATYLHVFDLAGEVTKAERMKRELEIARDIQHGLLPKRVPRMPGLDVDGACITAERVGGDYFDYITGGWAPPAFVIADVSGHNVGAAMLMAAFRMALKSETAMPLLPPAVVVRRLNAMLFDDLVNAEQFISMVCVQYQPISRTIRYTNAGHNPPLVYHTSSKRFVELATDDPLIGIERGEHFHEGRLALNKGDVLVMYTDGITEAANKKGVRFGVPRLKKLIAAQHKSSAAKLVSAICDAVKEYVGERSPADDVTVVVVKVI